MKSDHAVHMSSVATELPAYSSSSAAGSTGITSSAVAKMSSAPTLNISELCDVSPAKPAGPVLGPTRSLAIPLWCGLIVVVLSLLWLQMQTPNIAYNFLIEANGVADGAEVFVDGEKLGLIHEADENGTHLFLLRAKVHEGPHRLLVKKSNAKPFEEDIVVSGSNYFQVRLNPSK